MIEVEKTCFQLQKKSFNNGQGFFLLKKAGMMGLQLGIKLSLRIG